MHSLHYLTLHFLLFSSLTLHSFAFSYIVLIPRRCCRFPQGVQGESFGSRLHGNPECFSGRPPVSFMGLHQESSCRPSSRSKSQGSRKLLSQHSDGKLEQSVLLR